ncbi:MAG: amidohydrolase family protein [Anaerolineales bacterium]|nr:amidohydrolase family protein [Anaerolineales bacterium]
MNHPLVDSHIHFWHPNQLQYDWLAEVPAINRPFLPADLAEQAAGIDLQKIVFVQCDCITAHSLREVEWVTSLAGDEPRIQAIVAFAPLEKGAAASDHLETLSAYPLVKGVRRLIQSEGAGFCIQPDFVQGVQLLAGFGYSFDLCLLHHQLPDAIKLVEQCPQVSFVLDHLGKPAIKAGQLDPWRQDLKSLAAFPNVTCKISGAVTEADLAQWTPADLQPYLDHTIEVFGPDRVMYGGDWPVSLLATTYQTWLETLDAATAGLSAVEKEKLFYHNACAFYKLL